MKYKKKAIMTNKDISSTLENEVEQKIMSENDRLDEHISKKYKVSKKNDTIKKLQKTNDITFENVLQNDNLNQLLDNNLCDKSIFVIENENNVLTNYKEEMIKTNKVTNKINKKLDETTRKYKTLDEDEETIIKTYIKNNIFRRMKFFHNSFLLRLVDECYVKIGIKNETDRDRKFNDIQNLLQYNINVRRNTIRTQILNTLQGKKIIIIYKL